MGKRIELPAQPSGNATEQLQKMYSYLYQVATTINANLDEIGGMEFTDDEMLIVNKILNPDDAEEGTPSYNYKEAETLKSLIIKTANFVQQSLSEYRMNLLGEYVAEGKFGKYVRKTGLDVEITPEHIMQNYQLQEIIQGLKVYEINAKNYIKTGLLRTEQMLPVYGVAIGKDVVTFAEDGTETYNDGNKVAELTADALSFWHGGNMIAKYTGGRISFYYGSTEAFYIQNGKIYAAGDLEIVTGKKLIISTETFSIDGSGNVVLKGAVEIKSGKSLAIKSGGTFTVDSGNFSIDAQGNATFKGGGEFSGELKAASGTFAGTMSAACVTSGTMSCERISGGDLTLGGNNNVSGKLVIKDTNGNVIGTWDKDGINATKGTFAGTLNAATGTFAGTMSAECVTSGTMSCERISGGILTLGGNNNTNGQIVIKDANGAEIGKISKDGIVTSGNMKIESGGKFEVAAAGAVQIETGASSESYIKLGDGNFNADYQGGITGRLLSISDAAYIGGSRMISEALFRNLIYVGPTQPASGNGILWFKVSEVLYSRWKTSTGEASSSSDSTSNLTIDGDALTASTPYKYTLDFDAFPVFDGTATVYATITQANHQGVSVSIGNTGAIEWAAGTTKHITLAIQSNTILGDTSDDITVTWHVTVQEGYLFIILRNISLKIEGESGGVFNVTEIKYVQ